ncbi:lipopolysaccharide biosynthesis protein [Reichenbachiella versicolor]|uniref:lipopolysaccharide biosynthesis protein n=1 Tax=Reichenbachiella versicolor TaxID=1821036 RepID=UPI000D6E1D33|nr:polysaccharide biosynthesis C-terminal domain-containing protein [Reichenbachiella versicolor]
MALKKLAGDTVWYGGSSILTRMISYFMVPLYTAVFQIGEYGIVTEFYAYIAFLYVIYTYGIETTYFRFATKGEDEHQVFNLGLSSILVSSLVFSALLCFLATPIVNFLEYRGQESAIYYVSSIIFIDAIVAVPYARLRLKGKARKFAFIKLTQVSTTLGLNVFFLLICYPIVKGELFNQFQPFVSFWFDDVFVVKYVFVANLMANALILILLGNEFKGFNFTLNISQLKPILSYSFPLLFMGLAGVTNEMLSRALLKNWLPIGFYAGLNNQEALGIFGAVYKLSIFIQLGIQAFRYAAEPFFFSNAADKNSPQLFAKVMTAFVQFNAIVFLGICMNLDWLGMVILRNQTYQTGLHIVPFLLMGYIFSGVYYNLSVWYKVSDQTKYGAIITSVGAVLTVVLNFLLIPMLGYLGSAIVTFLVFFSMSLISYILGKRHFSVPYEVGKIFEVLFLASGIVYLMEIISWPNFWLSLAIRNMIVLCFVVYIYLRERKALVGRKVFGVTLP